MSDHKYTGRFGLPKTQDQCTKPDASKTPDREDISRFIEEDLSPAELNDKGNTDAAIEDEVKAREPHVRTLHIREKRDVERVPAALHLHTRQESAKLGVPFIDPTISGTQPLTSSSISPTATAGALLEMLPPVMVIVRRLVEESNGAYVVQIFDEETCFMEKGDAEKLERVAMERMDRLMGHDPERVEEESD